MAVRSSSTRPRHLERSEFWSGLRAGDAVVVDGPREVRHRYAFVAHVRNLETGEQWVEVRGGREGEAKDRSFRPEQIYDPAARRGSRLVGPSLAEAPRLDLGPSDRKVRKSRTI